MYIYIHVRALLRWPTAGRNEIHRHTFYDCCMLFPSLSFFVKIWPSKGRIGKHKRSRKKKLGFAVCWYIAFYIYYTRSRPADNPISSTKRSIILFIHSFIHSSSYVRVIIYFLVFVFILFSLLLLLLWVITEESGTPEMLTAPVGLTVYASVCVCVSMRECVRAVASVIVIRLYNWVYNNNNNSEMEEKSYPIILSV